MIFCSAAAATRIPKKPSQPTRPPFSTWDKRQQLQKTAFSHWLRAGLLQDHPVVRLFVCSSPCRKWPNTQENGCWLPPSDHIQSETLFSNQEGGMNVPASHLHSWHWVLFLWFSVYSSYNRKRHKNYQLINMCGSEQSFAYSYTDAYTS